MCNYTKSIQDLSSNAIRQIDKGVRTYISSYERKQSFKRCYDRHLSYFAQGKKFPFTIDDFQRAFSAKNFFKDLDDCGSWLEFRHYVDHDKTKLYHGNFCKRDKLCPACAVRRAYKQQVKFMNIIGENPDLIDRDWYYIVIPVKHNKSNSFEEVFSHIENIKKKISMQMRNHRRGKSSGFFSRFAGGMYSIEITHSKNGWNVHLNLLLNAPKVENGAFLSPDRRLGGLVTKTQIYNGKKKSTLSSPELSEWLNQFNGSFINSVTPLDFSSNEEILSNLVEIFKYALKFSSLQDQQLLEVFIKTRRKRLFGTFGNLWGKGLDNVSLDGDQALTGKFIELIFTRTFNISGVPSDVPTYQFYKREIKSEEKPENLESVHTGVDIVKFNIRKKNETEKFT
jgi:dimeric dUTPase (all-alpha-NTP-PPase superfamily)